jgi:hypothetical protein
MKGLSEIINEEAKSKSQRRLFGMALAYKKGELEDSEVTDEIIKLSEMPEKDLRDYAETKEKDLPEKIEERTVQVKRKYGMHDSISVGANAPVRANILGFIAEKGHCTKDELRDFINSKNEDSGSRTSMSWLKKNGKYIKEFKKDGCDCCKLSKLGQRVMNKTTINEGTDYTDKDIQTIKSFTNITDSQIKLFVDMNDIDTNSVITYLKKGKAKERVYAAMVFAGFSSHNEKEGFIKQFKK